MQVLDLRWFIGPVDYWQIGGQILERYSTTVQVRFLSRPLEKLVRGLRWKSAKLETM